MYTITNNSQFNSLEITFDGKPTEKVRDVLKGMRFRWHNIKKIWYGYGDIDQVKKALDGGEIESQVEPKPEEPKNHQGNIWLEKAKAILKNNGENIEGYMGSIGWKGGGSNQHNDITDINKEVKQMFKALYPSIKYSGKTQKYSGGCSLRITLTYPKEYINDFETFYQNARNYGIPQWVTLYDENGKRIGEELGIKHMNNDVVMRAHFMHQYDNWINSDNTGTTYRLMEDALLTEDGKKALLNCKALMAFYNYDDSNSTVDYYSTNFYGFIYFNAEH